MKITEIVFAKNYEGLRSFVDIKDTPDEFLKKEKDYKINIEKVPGFHSENDSYNSFTKVFIIKG